jgi:hypothetical protein
MAREWGVNFLVVDEASGSLERFPVLSFLLDPTKAPPDLKPVYAETQTPGHRIVVYRLAPNMR